MAYKDNDKFYLDYNSINKVIRYVRDNNKGCRLSFDVSKSPVKNSNSFYITIYYENTQGVLRLSDHDNKATAIGSKLRSFVIGKNTTIKNVCNILQERINKLKHKQEITRLNYLFNLIKREN